MIHARHLISAVLPLVLLASGCGANVARPVAAANALASKTTARAVAPDDASVFSEDNRKAQYWAQKFGGSAVLVMSIQTTALNTQKLSSSANVFFSPEAFYASQTCVFVARHYVSSWISQSTEVPDFNSLAAKLKGLPTTNGDPAPGQTSATTMPAWQIKAPAAWAMAHTNAPAPSANGQPAGNSATGKRYFASSRAHLVKFKDETNPTWNIYADGQRFVVDAITGETQAPTVQVNPNDRMNQGMEVDLQRASQVWLPMNPMQPNISQAPTASN